MNTSDLLPGVLLIGFGIFTLWALLVYPTDVKKEIALKALETYQLELKAGIVGKDSKVPALLRDHAKRQESKPAE